MKPIVVWAVSMSVLMAVSVLINKGIISAFFVEIICLSLTVVFTIVCACLWLFGKGDRKQERRYTLIGAVGSIVEAIIVIVEYFD